MARFSGKPKGERLKEQAKLNKKSAGSGSIGRSHDNIYTLTVTRVRRNHPPKEMTMKELQLAVRAVLMCTCGVKAFGFSKDSASIRFYTDEKTGDGISDS